MITTPRRRAGGPETATAGECQLTRQTFGHTLNRQQSVIFIANAPFVPLQQCRSPEGFRKDQSSCCVFRATQNTCVSASSSRTTAKRPFTHQRDGSPTTAENLAGCDAWSMTHSFAFRWCDAVSSSSEIRFFFFLFLFSLFFCFKNYPILEDSTGSGSHRTLCKSHRTVQFWGWETGLWKKICRSLELWSLCLLIVMTVFVFRSLRRAALTWSIIDYIKIKK